MKSKSGRPKLPEGEAKSAVIRARVSPSERKALELAAKASGEGFSEWARNVLISATKRLHA
jgi:hypothetical protein